MEKRRKFRLICVAVTLSLTSMLISLSSQTGRTGVSEEVPRTAQGVKEYLKSKYGTNWNVFWNDVFNIPRTLQGEIPGISKKANEENIQEITLKLLSEYAELMSWRLNQIGSFHKSSDNHYISGGYYQEIDGVRVEGGGIGIRILKSKLGRGNPDLVTIGGNFYPGVTVSTEAKIILDDAVDVATREYRKLYPHWEKDTIRLYADNDELREVYHYDPKLIILPTALPNDETERHVYNLVYRIEYLRRIYYINAFSGDVVRSVPKGE